MSKQYNLNKSKEAKGYYIDITRPYEQVVQDITKLIPNAANEKYIINGTGNHSLQEWIENHKNEGHTLIDATPPVKQQSHPKKSSNNKDNSTRDVSQEDFSRNKDISSSVYNEHFDRGNTFVDPSSNKYMDIKQRLRWDNAEAKNRAFNRQADLIYGGALYGGAGMYAAGAAAPWIATTFAPGTVGGNILGDTAGMIALDETSKALTGRTTGQHIGDALGLAEDSNWRYAVDFANPINIAGPALLRKGVSAGINYAEKVANPYKVFNTLRLPIKINGFQERPVLVPKSQYNLTLMATSSPAQKTTFKIDSPDINVSPEILTQREANNLNATEIYNERLKNGSFRKVINNGTVKYYPDEIEILTRQEDLPMIYMDKDMLHNPLPFPYKKEYTDRELKLASIIRNLRKEQITNPKSRSDVHDYLIKLNIPKQNLNKYTDYICAPINEEVNKAVIGTQGNYYSPGFNYENYVYSPTQEILASINKYRAIGKGMQKYWKSILPHELEHALQDGDKVYINFYSPKYAIPFLKLNNEQFTPEEFSKMVDEMNKLIGFHPTRDYLAKPTELLARGTQIKNWLGITDPQYQLTAKDLKEAAKYYTQTGPDNDMTEFFNSITDWDKAAKFLSYATAVAGVGSTVGLNNTKLVKKPNK